MEHHSARHYSTVRRSVSPFTRDLCHARRLCIHQYTVATDVALLRMAGNRTKAAERMQGYSISTYFTFGYAGDEILKKAKEDKTNVIIMTKSTKSALIRMIGSTTSHVVKGAKCVVMIVPE